MFHLDFLVNDIYYWWLRLTRHPEILGMMKLREWNRMREAAFFFNWVFLFPFSKTDDKRDMDTVNFVIIGEEETVKRIKEILDEHLEDTYMMRPFIITNDE